MAKSVRPLSKYAERKAATELSRALEDLPDNYLACRDMRHAWQVEQDYHVRQVTAKNRIKEIGRSLGCMRCPVKRIETYHATATMGLDKVRQHYVYPEPDGETPAYQIKGAPRGVKPQALVQAEQYRRYLEKVAGVHQELETG